MPTIESVKIKFEAAQKSRNLSVRTRNELQAIADAESDPTIKEILTVAVIEITTSIAQMDIELLEVSDMIVEYERRTNPIHIH